MIVETVLSEISIPRLCSSPCILGAPHRGFAFAIFKTRFRNSCEIPFLPPRFIRIRHYGFLASRNKKECLNQIRKIIGVSVAEMKQIKASVQEMMLELTGVDIMICPDCRKGKMEQVHKILLYTGQSAELIIRPPNIKIPV